VGSGRLESSVRRTGADSMEVSIASIGFSYLVRTEVDHPGARFSDNYFDLRDGQSATVTVHGLPVGAEPGDLRIGAYAGPR